MNLVIVSLLVSILSLADAAIWSSDNKWEVIHKQSDHHKGHESHPAIRYGHAAEQLGGKMIMTLGYYYDRENHVATWLSDTWEMGMKPPHSWILKHEGITKDESYIAYNGGYDPHSPTGRFGHSTGTYNGTLYVYGGHDGGISRHGKQNYEPGEYISLHSIHDSNTGFFPGYDFDELWSYDITGPKGWNLVKPFNSPQGPGKRYLHGSSVVGNKFLVYGGLQESQGDTWAYDFPSNTWELLSPEVIRSNGGPGRRVGHTMTPIDQPMAPGSNTRVRGLLVLGGRVIDPDGSSTLDPTPFFFDLDKKIWRPWRNLPSVTDGAVPAGRKYHAEGSAWVAVADDGSLITATASASRRTTKSETPTSYVQVTVISGGTTTTPGLTCTAESWIATVDCAGTTVSWLRLPDLPLALYDIRGATSPEGASFMFGGHLCTEGKDSSGLPYYYTNSVYKLDLTKGVKVPASACRVSAQSLPKQRGRSAEAHAEDREDL